MRRSPSFTLRGWSNHDEANLTVRFRFLFAQDKRRPRVCLSEAQRRVFPLSSYQSTPTAAGNFIFRANPMNFWKEKELIAQYREGYDEVTGV